MLAFQLGGGGNAHPVSGHITSIQNDLLIYFHGDNDNNGCILMPVRMEIGRNINADRAEVGAHSYALSGPMCTCVPSVRDE